MGQPSRIHVQFVAPNFRLFVHGLACSETNLALVTEDKFEVPRRLRKSLLGSKYTLGYQNLFCISNKNLDLSDKRYTNEL